MAERHTSGERNCTIGLFLRERGFFAVVLVACLICASAWAQDPVASLEVGVRDPSGAAVTGATVTVTNLDTNYSKNQLTGSNGFYRLSSLPIGRYSVSIEAAGFAHFRQQPVRLNVSQTVRIDAQLELVFTAPIDHDRIRRAA